MKINLLCFLYSMPLALCIMGGEDRPQDGTSFMVSIRDDRNNHFCCGALIAEQFVLTAATCVKDRTPRHLKLLAGITSLTDKNGTELVVEKIFQKDPTGRNDVHNNIALLRIAHYEYNRNMYPIRLQEEGNDPIHEGKQCYTYGWGQKYHNLSRVTNTIQRGTTLVSKLGVCRAFNNDVDESNVCTYGYGVSLCKYDTGNPLLSSGGGWYLMGIATEQHSCGGLIDNVYTRVDSHVEWIRQAFDEYYASSVSVHKPQILAVIGIIAVRSILLN